jgi:hypothetical protein
VSDSGFGFNPTGRSAAGATGRHQDCGHVRSATRPLVSPDRVRSTITLCPCVCHGTCLLAKREPVSLTTWQELCKCPGAAERRAWKTPDDVWAGFTEHWEQTRREQQERREAKKQAEHAVRDAAYGKTREELRDLYIAEFRARGLDLPPRGLPRGGDRPDDRPSAARALEAVAAHFLRHLTARSPEHNSRGTRQQAAAASGRESKRLQRPVRPA